MSGETIGVAIGVAVVWWLFSLLFKKSDNHTDTNQSVTHTSDRMQIPPSIPSQNSRNISYEGRRTPPPPPPPPVPLRGPNEGRFGTPIRRERNDMDPLDYPCCPIHKCRNRIGQEQVIFWDAQRRKWRCHKGHYFSS